MPRTRFLTILLALLVALPLAACGGDEKKDTARDDYIRDARQVESKFETEFQGALESIQKAKTPKENLAGLESTQSALSKAGEGLHRLTPPDDYKDVHAKLLDALLSAEGEVALVIDTAKDGDEDEVRNLQSRVEKSFTALAAAGKEFDAKVPQSPS